MRNIYLLISFLFFGLNGYNQTFTSTTDVNIPDCGSQICSNINVTGVGTIDGTYGLQSVCIKINHPYDGDLDIYLTAPDGTIIELSTDNGGSNNNYGNGGAGNGGTATCFEMGAPAGNITGGTAPFQNTYIPEGDLGNVNNGQNANGSWQLCVTDDACGDVGFINAWQLTFSNTPASPGTPGHNIGTGNLNVCSGNLFDSGGSSGDYSSYELITETYCSDAGNCIQVTFNSFDTESCCDDLTIYDGPNTSGPLIGVYAGSTSPGTITSTSGCLTFVWDSDGSVQGAGWSASVSCVTCPAPTCSDGILNQDETGIDCGGATCPACPAATAEDCLGGTSICSDASFSGNSSGFGDQELTGTNEGCLTGDENQSSWYFFEAQSGGTLEFLIAPQNGTDDYDFAMWGPYPSGSTPASICPPAGAPVRCSFAAGAPTNYGGTGLMSGAGDNTEGVSGDDIVNPLVLAAGDVYILVIDNYSESTSPFDMDLSLSGGLDLNCTTLPVELLNFNGYPNEGYNLLQWTTATEINNDYFEIEKSHDGVLFNKIGELQGSGNNTGNIKYEFIDDNPNPGISYYRLRQVDFNGKFEYSNTVAIKQSLGAEVSIFPNPTSDRLKFNFVSKEGGNFKIVINDLSKTIYSESMYIEAGNNIINLDYFKLIAKGFYFVKVIDEQGNTIKIDKIIRK